MINVSVIKITTSDTILSRIKYVNDDKTEQILLMLSKELLNGDYWSFTTDIKIKREYECETIEETNKLIYNLQIHHRCQYFLNEDNTIAKSRIYLIKVEENGEMINDYIATYFIEPKYTHPSGTY